MNHLKMNRRDFIRMTAMSATIAGVTSPFNILKAGVSPNNVLNVASIGLGKQGALRVNQVRKEGNVVALCDCDQRNTKDRYANYRGYYYGKFKTDEFYEKYSSLPKFTDYRVMLDKMGKDIDAVIIATPDHSHCSIAVQCMKQGKHVFVEKPMAHNINELRIMADTAKEYKVATQMGNQGRSASSPTIWNWIKSDAIGKVKDINFFINNTFSAKNVPIKSSIPKGVDWDLWQNVAQSRDYCHDYTPFSWRQYDYYGTGIHGDLCCHLFDASYWALNLGAPNSIYTEGEKAKFSFGYSDNFKTIMKFPARGDLVLSQK